MIECETITRRWGNSIGITLPKEIVEREHLKEDERITVLILKQHPSIKSTFGMLRGKLSKSAQQIKDECRAELYHD
ncbi:MAG: AbrB/MazE/SpoVT family DNA-binding domain-containing protein [Nanoarchaeota archaeon]